MDSAMTRKQYVTEFVFENGVGARELMLCLFDDMIGISFRLATDTSCAVTNEAPHWQYSRRGRIP
jgi:hypothetical protein